ncbi:MAG: VWA domain-containing protein [Candidatus Hydrogenedentes bacterium]|nr:VWA domain-containing protein [Candidatus Hydrogenedentota bacterium]
MRFEFETPLFLIALVAIPAALLVLRRTLLDSPRAQLALSTAVRAFVILLLVLALANSLLGTKSTRVSVLVLADLSDSTPQTAIEQTKNLFAKVQTHATNPGRAGLITFASGIDTVVPVTARPQFPEILKKPTDAADTSIELALQRAREIMPADTINRIAILTDGNETVGDAMAAAKRCANHGIRLYSIPYAVETRDEVLLEDLNVPAEVKRGQSFSVSATVHATRDTDASFVLYRNGFKVQEKAISLKAGANALSFDETNPAEGLTKYELHVSAASDFFADNNVAGGIVSVEGKPRVLLLEKHEQDARYLARALEAEDISVEVREGKGMPATLDELAAFDAVLMSDVPATDVSVQQMNLLRSYIEDLGGGFIMIGGEESFALGGYYRTAIEDALPVRMRSEKKKDTPSLAMMLVIDHSGSMGGEKMELAKEAAIAATELLGPRDAVGVIAFDSEPTWVVDLQAGQNQQSVIQAISTIEAAGGTSIYPAMVEAHAALSHVPTQFKHVILLTDGISEPGDFQGIVSQMQGDRITVSTVAVGEGADTVLLQDLANLGKGRYYFTADPYDIPQIFSKETMSASKSSLIEEPFLAQLFKHDPIVQGIDWQTSPFLFGYVVTAPKSTAKVLLASERGDPLLVKWQFGLGKSVAFTSDAKSRWASDWLSWPGYGKFWSQVVRDAMRLSDSKGTETSITLRGNEGHIAVDNIDENGNFVNGLSTSAQLIDPSLGISALTFEQSGPGRYEATTPIRTVGSYLFKIRQAQAVYESGGDVPGMQTYSDFTRGITVSYKPEYRHLGTNEPFLKELATVGGGTFNPAVEDLFAVGPDEFVFVRQRLWPWLLLVAVLLFVIDVAVRRLDLAGWRVFKSPQRYG